MYTYIHTHIYIYIHIYAHTYLQNVYIGRKEIYYIYIVRTANNVHDYIYRNLIFTLGE